MPKIFDTHGPGHERRPEHKKHSTMGSGPAGPSAQLDNRLNTALIGIALAILLAVLLISVARGEELQGMAAQPQTTQSSLVQSLPR